MVQWGGAQRASCVVHGCRRGCASPSGLVAGCGGRASEGERGAHQHDTAGGRAMATAMAMASAAAAAAAVAARGRRRMRGGWLRVEESDHGAVQLTRCVSRSDGRLREVT